MAAVLLLSFVSVVLVQWLAYTELLKLAKGWPRFILLLLLLPVLAWPAFMVHSIFARAVVVFILVWVCPSKLLAIAMDTPIDVIPPGSSFFQFAVANLLPLRVLGPATHNNPHSAQPLYRSWGFDRRLVPVLHLATLFISANYIHLNRHRLSNWVSSAIYCVFIYSAMEITMSALAKLARLMTGLEIAPSFNNPFLASSLSEFWGRRWNLLVTAMLRANVYNPIVRFLTLTRSRSTTPGQGLNAAPLVARSVATLASFVVSGLVHEVIFCCINQSMNATWEVTLFFVIHGVAAVAEVFFRKRVFNNRHKMLLPQPVGVVLTLGFMYITVVGLFLPPVTRTGSDVKTIAEVYRFQSMVLDLFRF